MLQIFEDEIREIAAALDRVVSRSLYGGQLDRARATAAKIVSDPLHRVTLQLAVGLDEVTISVTATSSKGKAVLVDYAMTRDDETADRLAAEEARTAAEKVTKERAPRAPYTKTGKYARKEDQTPSGLDLPSRFFSSGASDEDD